MLSCTGHRLNGYPNSGDPQTVYERLLTYAHATVKLLKPTEVVAGGAIGWDMAMSEAAVVAGVSLSLYLPFPNYQDKWPAQWVNRMAGIKSHADLVTYHRDTPTEDYGVMRLCYLRRNEAMVRVASAIAMMFNGDKTGGTHYTYMYALRYRQEMKLKLPIYNLYRMWDAHRLPTSLKELKGWTTVDAPPF